MRVPLMIYTIVWIEKIEISDRLDSRFLLLLLSNYIYFTHIQLKSRHHVDQHLHHLLALSNFCRLVLCKL